MSDDYFTETTGDITHLMETQTKQETPIRVVVVEDHELSRNGIIVSLQKKSNFDIIAEAGQGDEAVEVVRSTQPDVVLMDIELPVYDGIHATQEIKKLAPETRVIMLTSHDDREVVLASLTAGADAYCMKDINADRLVQVIRMVYEGAIWMDPAIAKIVLDTWTGQMPAMQRGTRESTLKTDLTDRELEILQDIVGGLSNQEIAEHLYISLHTVKVHVRNIIDKMTVSDRTQAAVKAIREGLVQLD